MTSATVSETEVAEERLEWVGPADLALEGDEEAPHGPSAPLRPRGAARRLPVQNRFRGAADHTRDVLLLA